MMTVYRQGEKALLPIEKPEPNCWINITQPDNYEISCLINDYGLDAEVLNDILDTDEQARIEKDEDKVFLIVRIPIFRKDREQPYSTIPLGIILFKDMILTICLQENEILHDMITGKAKRFFLDNAKIFLLTVFSRVSFYYLRYLKEINRKCEQTEKQLLRAVKNKELIQLFTLEKSLVFFATSLKSNEFLFGRIQKSSVFSENETELLDDVITDNRQAIEMANIYSDILSGMMDAFASVISNNLNVVMKHLAVISLILMLPTLIASIYGMNVELPFQSNPFAFIGTLAVSGVLAIVSIIIFRRKNFF